MWWLCSAMANPYLSGPAMDPIAVGAVEKDPFVWSAPTITGERTVVFVLTVPEGYAVYRDELQVKVVSGKAGEPRFPEPKLAVDPSNPEEWRALYDGDVRIELPVEPGDLVVELSHQGCRKGLCWPHSVVTKTVAVR